MGCCTSQPKVQQPRKQQPLPLKKEVRSLHGSELFLVGLSSKNKPLSFIYDPVTQSTEKLMLPHKCSVYNYATLTKLSKDTFLMAGGINQDLTEITNKVHLYKIGDAQIMDLPPMIQQRYTHFAALFQGFYYVFGGRTYGSDEEAILAKCERIKISDNNYNTKRWEALPEMLSRRCTGFSLVYRNMIYVFGGYKGQFQRPKSIERLNPGRLEWQKLDIQLNVGIQSAMLACHQPNQFMILGGQTNNGPSSKCIIVNLKDQTIKACLKLSAPKVLAKGCRYNKDLFILGGEEESIMLEKYNLQNQKSQIIKKLTAQQFQLQLEVTDFDHLSYSQQTLEVPFSNLNANDDRKPNQDDDVVYIFGTREEPFILQFNISAPYTKLFGVPYNLQLNCHQGGLNIAENKFLIFGGIDDSFVEVSNHTSLYDHANKHAETWGPMSTARYAFTFQRLGDSVYVMAGGTTNQSAENNLIYLKLCQKLDLKKKIWANIADLPEGVMSPMSLVHNQKIYFFGGMLENQQRNVKINRYSPEVNEWRLLDFKLSFGIEAGSIFQHSPNEFYIFGGRLTNGDSDGIWSLSILQDSQSCVFQQKGRMTEPKSLHTIYGPAHQDFLVVFGGTKEVLGCYGRNSLQRLQNDSLLGVEQILKEGLSKLNQESMKNFLIVMKQH